MNKKKKVTAHLIPSENQQKYNTRYSRRQNSVEKRKKSGVVSRGWSVNTETTCSGTNTVEARLRVSIYLECRDFPRTIFEESSD